MKVRKIDECFCPNCRATLNYQDEFDPSLGAWTCTECGHINEDSNKVYFLTIAQTYR